MWNPVVATEAGFLAVIGCIFFFNAMHYWSQVIDDAYIAFRFAENLAGGKGLRFNPGDRLVEGFTSPAWVILSAGAIRMGWDPMVAAKIAGLLSGFALIGLSWWLAKSLRGRTDAWNLLPPVMIATNAHVAFWSMQGMETLLQSAAVLAAYGWTWRWLHDGKCGVLSAVAIVFAVFVRIDSLVLMAPLGIMVVGFAMVRLVRDWRKRPLKESGEAEAGGPRMLPWFRWMGVVAGGLIVLQAMRLLIFGEWLPNTYYAKVAFAPWNGERAHAYLFEFFFNQGGWAENRDGGSVAWWLSGGPVNSLAWMNLWLGTITLLVFGMARLAFDKSVRACALTVGAVAVCAWYAWHIGGDWMPGFRFLIPCAVLLFCAAPVAMDVWERMTEGRPRVRVAGLALFLLLCVGTITEQARTETAYVFGRDPIWVERNERWLSVAAVGAKWRRGFEPALLETTAVLALETQSGARILMSDIGLPMWSSPHLHVIDADGLVDKHLGDAPGVRGEVFGGEPLPTRREIERELREFHDDRPLSSEVRRWLRTESARLYRKEVMARNVRMIMDQIRPEYIMVFEVHPGVGTSDPGHRYPEVIDRATRHPQFDRYVLQQSWPKLDGNVWNHLYRRDDVPGELKEGERRERLEQLVARNPRVGMFQVMLLAGRLVDVDE